MICAIGSVSIAHQLHMQSAQLKLGALVRKSIAQSAQFDLLPIAHQLRNCALWHDQNSTGHRLPLSACGIADHYQAQGRMQKAEDAYRQCLVQHTADPASCNELKKFYEQDKAAYEKT